MFVIEFYLKSGVPEEVFEVLCDTFYSIPSPFKRRVNGNIGSAVFAVSRNPATKWVQLLIDEDTPTGVLTAIRSKAKALSSNGSIAEYASDEGKITGKTVIAPMEKVSKNACSYFFK